MADALSTILETTQAERLATGFGFTEGPLWDPINGCYYFVDLRRNLLHRITPGKEPEVVRENTGEGNGTTFDLQGRIVMCEGGNRRITRRHADGRIDVLVDRFEGKRLNRPNDVVVKSDGSIYFTDPGLGRVESELDFCGIYRVSPDRDSMHLLVRDCVLPNGLCFSPDESILYINDSRRRHIRAFDVEPTGLLALASDRVLCTMTGERPGNPDGMKVDLEGNVYCTGPGGIWIMDRAGTHLGTILTRKSTTNMAWGDADWSTMYFTTRHTLGRVQLKIPGVPVPRGTL